MMGAGVEGDIHDMITMLEEEHDGKKREPAAIRPVVVVTGFEGDDSTSVIIDELRKKGIDGYYLALQKLPTNYKDVGEKVPRLWKVYNAALVIHIGTRSVSRTVKFEQQAFRDEENQNEITETVLRTEISCGALANHLNKKQESKSVKIEKSENPEKTLAGFSYFLSLHEDRSKALLINVPSFDAECTKEIVAQVVRDAILAVAKKEIGEEPEEKEQLGTGGEETQTKSACCCSIM